VEGVHVPASDEERAPGVQEAVADRVVAPVAVVEVEAVAVRPQLRIVSELVGKVAE